MIRQLFLVGVFFIAASAQASTVGRWRGWNCQKVTNWRNIVDVTIYGINPISPKANFVIYTYPDYNNDVCSARLWFSSGDIGGTVNWREESLTQGCIAGKVTTRYFPVSDTLTYTWVDPTGQTPTCTGTLTRVVN